jgi:hypothetical protein
MRSVLPYNVISIAKLKCNYWNVDCSLEFSFRSAFGSSQLTKEINKGKGNAAPTKFYSPD